MPTPSFLPRGLWIPVVTPFCDGRLDTASLERLIDNLAARSVDGLIFAATTGEGLTLSDEETERLVAAASRVVAERLPVYLSLAGSDTSRLAARVAEVSAWPIDGLLISCPYYSRPSQLGLYEHFAALAAATDRPVVLYNIPYRTGVNLGNETLLRLAEIPNVVGLKDCCTVPAQTFDLLRRKPQGLSVMTGEDAHYFTALAHGAEGAILASAHIETDGFAEVHRLLSAGDHVGALRQWSRLVDLTKLLFAEPSPAAIKHLLWREGLIASPELRLPLTPVSSGLAARLDALIAEPRSETPAMVV